MPLNARLWLAVLAAHATFIVPAAARPQSVPQSLELQPGAGETICLPVLRLWNGTVDDIRRIESDPVPASYRSGQQSCGGPLRAVDLIGWHDRFGTEASVTTALSFVERRDARARDQAERNMRRHIATALAAISAEYPQYRAASGPPPDAGVAEGIYRDFLEHSEAAATLVQTLERLNILLAPAELHLAAADAFASPRFRDAARARLEASDRALAVAIAPSGTDPIRRAALDYALRESRIGRTSAMLHLRLALLDARSSGAEGDIANAEALLKTMRQPGYDEIFRDSFEGGRDFCDLPEHHGEALAEQCEEDERAIKAFKYQEAVAALLRGRTDPAQEYLEMYRRDRKDNGDWDTLWTGVDTRIVTLQAAIGDANVRLAGTDGPRDRNGYDRAMKLDEALEAYVAAIRLIDPAANPVQFRAVATRALAAHAAMTQVDRDGEVAIGDRHGGSMAYLRVMLAQLDDIAQARI